MKFKIVRISELSQNELDLSFEIIKNNMIELGYAVSEKDKEIWCINLKKHFFNNQFYFYLVLLNSEIVGFVELIDNKEYLFLSEIQLSTKVKQTRVLLYILQYLFECEEFKKFDSLYFTILKINKMSNKTFVHLGGELVEELKTKNRYKITREKVANYLKKFKTKSKY